MGLEGNRLRRTEPARDLVHRPVKRAQQVHHVAEGLGHRRPLAAQILELALQRAEVTADLAELAAELLAPPLRRLETLAQTLPLRDQRRDDAVDHLLAFGEPPGHPLRIFESLLPARLRLAHLP